MKLINHKNLIILISSALYFFYPSILYATDVKQIKIMSYNIQGGCSAPMDEGSYNLDNIIEVIKNANADVILLQEVQGKSISKGTCAASLIKSQYEEIATKLGMNYVYSDHLEVLSNSKLTKLSSGLSVTQKVLVEITDGLKFLVYNTHPPRFDIPARKELLQQISKMAESETQPTIVGGDFNECEGYPTQLFSANFITALGSNTTFTSKPPGKQKTINDLIKSSSCSLTKANISERLDYIFADKKNWSPVSGFVNTAAGTASDHFPIVCIFKNVPFSPMVAGYQPGAPGNAPTPNQNPADNASLTQDLFRSYDGKQLTDSELQKFLQKPVPKIKIPGLVFSDLSIGNLVKDDDGRGYIYFPFLGEYISAIFKYAVVAVGIIATVMLIISGLQWMLPGAESENVSSAKKRIEQSIIGLIITVCSYSILFIINPELVNFKSLKVRYIMPAQFPMVSTIQDDASINDSVTDENIAIAPSSVSEVNKKMFSDKRCITIDSDSLNPGVSLKDVPSSWSLWQALTSSEKEEVYTKLFKDTTSQCTVNLRKFTKTDGMPEWTGVMANPEAMSKFKKAYAIAKELDFSLTRGSAYRSAENMITTWNSCLVERYVLKHKHPIVQNKYIINSKDWPTNQGLVSSPNCKSSPHAQGGAFDVYLTKDKEILSTNGQMKSISQDYMFNHPYDIILENIMNHAGCVRLCTEAWHFECGLTKRYDEWKSAGSTSRCWAYGKSNDEPIPEATKQEVNKIVGRELLK